MKVILATLLLAVSGVAAATTARIGTTEFTVPAPEGFAPATADMVPLYPLLETFVADTNGELASFLSQADAARAMQGEIPEMSRRFSAQYPLAAADATLSTRDFAEVRQAVAAENAEIARTIHEKFPNLMDRANEGLSQLSDTAAVMSISELVPLPAHEDDERRHSYSAYVTLQITDDAGNSTPFVSVVNATLVHLRGKLLILYAFGGEDDLEWAREAGAAWTDAVVSANPGTPGSSLTDALPTAGGRIDWAQATMRGLLTGLVVGVVAVVVARMRKRG
ncbi:hypothetical protein [Alkalisalibacterium limincola]|uniref:Uncharacterized protein n=1 Tax=Alkalisalibacterium limincola TaxID=2699169 RepID=A0A5C8KS01_9GAMM|nr:hypothetical protein [Alkalisalibacterium limincola]TXK62300.1 hypothetical protein FU658_08675 [Alkalisalibacterium limincola]